MKKFIKTGLNQRDDDLTEIIRIEDHLQHREHSAGKVEKNVADAPSLCAFPPVIHHSLWHVLDERNRQLNVAAGVEEVQPVPDTGRRNAQSHDDDNEEDRDDTAGDIRDSLVGALEISKFWS